MHAARDAILSGTPADNALSRARKDLASAGFRKVDYFALVDSASLEPVADAAGETRLIAAATIGATRLIDNLAV